MVESSLNMASNGICGPLLLTIDQVAELLNLGRTKTYEIVMSKSLESIKVGRRRLVPRDSVDDYVSKIRRQEVE